MIFTIAMAIVNFLDLRGIFIQLNLEVSQVIGGNGLDYDWHSHEAEEIYLNLGGNAIFRTKEEEILLNPNETKMHHSWQSHSMITHKEAILTFVLWRGKGMFGLPKMD